MIFFFPILYLHHNLSTYNYLHWQNEARLLFIPKVLYDTATRLSQLLLLFGNISKLSFSKITADRFLDELFLLIDATYRLIYG